MATKENRLLKNTNIKIKEGKEKYSMFPYQEEAIKNLEKLDKVYDTYRTLVVVPTGGGKTRIAVEYLNRNVLNRQGTKVLWICERLSLLTQAHHSFVDHTYRDSLEHGGKPLKASEITAHVFSSQDTSFREEYKSEDVQMVFVTKQTLCKMFGFDSGKQKGLDESFKDWLENTDELTVIIDEAHHAVGDDYRNIISTLLSKVQKKKIHIIGLTATPKNTNGSRIEEIFLHGIDPKSKQPTDKTCYASRVSINQLIAEGYLAKPFLAKKKDSSPEKLSDRKLCNRIIDTYEKGVCALALETPSSQDEDTKVPKELNPNNSFGQTVIFVKSREVARLLWSKFLARDIDCGISISTDGNNDLTQYKNLQDYIERIKENMKNRKDKALSSDQIVKIYEERYAKNILPVIVSVDKFKEGVDVPKTQTVFIARDSSTEISVTQMVGRALRGVLQGGTSEAYLVEFEDEQLNKILWEVPERDNLEDFLKKHSILLGMQVTAGNIASKGLNMIDLEALNALIANNAKVSDIIKNLCDYMPMQSSPADEGDLIIPNEVIRIDIPIGYVTFGQRYLLVWNKTKDLIQVILNTLNSLGVNDLRKLWDEYGISATSLRQHIQYLDDYTLLNNIPRDNTYKNIYWNYVHTILFYIFEVNKGKEDEAIKKMQEQDIEVERFVDYKKPELCEIAYQIITGTFQGEIDDFLNEQWKKYGTALSNQSNQLGVSELYFKAYFKQFYMKTAEVKQDIAESDYFRIRLYRDGRKRENLVKLLQLILKGGVAQNVYSDTFDFYDVFGGTGTMTVSLKDTVKGKRHLNEFDVVVAKALYFIKKYEHRLPDDFKKTFAEFNDKWYDIIKDMKTSIDQKKMYAHLKSIFENTEYRERYGKDATKGKSAEKIIRDWAKGINYDTKYDNKQKRITANRESLYEAIGAKDQKIMNMERKYLEKRYDELLILEEVLKKPEVQNVVEMYLALYVSFEDYIKQMNDDEKTTKEQREAWQNQINSDTLKLTPRDRLLVFAFLYVHSFASYIVSKSSEAGVDPKGIERFKKLLSGEETWLDEFSDRLQDVDITSKDFKEIVPETSDNESNNKVYYLDPPYFLTNQYACEFSDENHLEMLKRLREAEYNWIFSCKSKETNESLSKRKKGDNTKYIHTEEGKLFEEYFKLFLYDKKVDTNSKEVCADTEKGIIQKKDLYVYYAEPLEDNYYEIMISNIPPNKDDAQVLKSYNFRCEEFKSFFKNHCNYDI